MPLVYSHENHIFRVDGDVLETFVRGASEHRILLPWLAVQIFPLAKDALALQIGSAPQDLPLYEVFQKAKAITGRKATVQLNISREEEPFVREFFTQVAQLCGRRIMVP